MNQSNLSYFHFGINDINDTRLRSMSFFNRIPTLRDSRTSNSSFVKRVFRFRLSFLTRRVIKFFLLKRMKKTRKRMRPYTYLYKVRKHLRRKMRSQSVFQKTGFFFSKIRKLPPVYRHLEINPLVNGCVMLPIPHWFFYIFVLKHSYLWTHLLIEFKNYKT